MPSLKSINAEAGTNFRRWKEVTAMAKEAVTPKPPPPPPPSPFTEEEMKVCQCECGCKADLDPDSPFKVPVCEPCSMDVHMEKEAAPVLEEDTQPVQEQPQPVPEEQPQPTPEEQPQPVPKVVRSEDDWPPKLSDRVAYQMRGKGFTVRDGWPVAGGRGTFTTEGETWKYGDDGQLHIVWNHHPWNEQRNSMYEVIIDQPLVRAGDGSLDPSMFKTHCGWIDHMSEYQEKKLNAVREGVESFASDRVAWFQDGVLIYQTTIGALLEQSLSLRA